MIDREKVISGLQYTIEMFLFDPGTGYSKDPDDLNAADRITYDACIGAIVLLKEQEAKIEQLNRFVNGFSRDAIPIVRCKDCKKRYTVLCIQEEAGNINNQDDWFCADGVAKDTDVLNK